MNPWKVVVLGLSASILATVACSSSSSSPSGSGSLCQNPTPAEAACSSCKISMCPSQLAAIQDSCASYVACAEKCDCSDSACEVSCLDAASASCQSIAFTNSCDVCDSACASATNDSGTGTGGGSGTGTGSGTSSAGVTCFDYFGSGTNAMCSYTSGEATCSGLEKPGQCPSSGLVGCCVSPVSATISSGLCIYGSASASTDEKGCATGGGMWTTKLP